MLLFSNELLTLLQSGLHVGEAVSALHAKERTADTRIVLEQLRRLLEEGRTLSEAMAAMSRHFSEVYVATLRAAERTGDVPNALARYVAYQNRFDAIRKTLATAAIYPTLLLVVGAAVGVFLLGYVVPSFSAMYESSGRDIPWLSARLMDFGRAIHDHAAIFAVVAACLVAFCTAALTRTSVRSRLVGVVLAAPGIGPRVDQFRFARLLRALSLLLASGIPLVQALDMAQGFLGPGGEAALRRVRSDVNTGCALSRSFADAGLSDAVTDSLLRVGERSGELALMLERGAQFGEEEFARWMEWVTRLLEPLLMLFIGGVIGTVVVLMYLPIFELAGSLQ